MLAGGIAARLRGLDDVFETKEESRETRRGLLKGFWGLLESVDRIVDWLPIIDRM